MILMSIIIAITLAKRNGGYLSPPRGNDNDVCIMASRQTVCIIFRNDDNGDDIVW